MLRGDDVSELQRRLNALGFDAGREDGILGPETETALRQFQRERGPRPRRRVRTGDRRAPRSSVGSARRRVGRGGARARDAAPRRAPPRRPAPVPRRRPGARRARRGDVAARLGNDGAIVALDTSGDDHERARRAGQPLRRRRRASRSTTGAEPGVRCAYFANQTFRSEGGLCLAHGMTESLRAVLPDVDEPVGPHVPAPARDADGRGRVRARRPRRRRAAPRC